MYVSVNDYADFVTATSAIGAVRSVFYWDNTAIDGQYYLTAFVADGKLAVRTTQSGQASLPGSFSTDFPGAVALANPFGLT